MIRTTSRLTATCLAVALTSATAVTISGSGIASAGPCSEMFGNFGSLMENQTGAGMGTGGSLGSADSTGDSGSAGSSGSSGSLGSSGSTGEGGLSGSASRALGSSDRSGSLVQQLETGSLGNGLSGSLNSAIGSAYGMPPWITGAQGTVPVLNGPTQFLQLVTGPTSPNESISRYGVAGTDLGIMWDNGDAANPKILMAFGDTMGDCSVPGNQWRSNVLFRSADTDLSDGLTVDSAPTDENGQAKSLIPRTGLPGETTIIPTAGISVEGVQYMRYMSVAQWGRPGAWTTNYSGMAYSTDDGENWTVMPSMSRPITDTVPLGEGAPPVDDAWRGSQMSSYLKADGYLYEYLTPSGRQGAVTLARVPLADSPKPEDLADGNAAPSADGILDPEAYEYWDGSAWVSDVSAADTVLPSPASEMSVMWNDHLGKYTSMYSQGYNSVVMRTADRPEGPWEDKKVLVDYSMLPGVYGSFMHPWAQGEDLYYLVTTWNSYNVFLVRTSLSEIYSPSQPGTPGAETQPETEVVRQVPVSELVDGKVPTE